MKNFLVKIANLIHKTLHNNFEFLNAKKSGEFNKNYEWIYKYISKEEYNISQSSFIEIGSRDGLDALDIMSKFNFAKAYIFEPSHAGIKQTITNLKNNKNFSKNITLFPTALGEEDGEVKFYEYINIAKNHSRANIGASTVYGTDNENYISYKVPIFRLDNLKLDIVNNFMIIMDCEGSEYSVLKGSTKVIKSNKYICLESSYKNANGNCEDITAFLEKQNYTLIDCDWPNTKNGNLPNKDVVNKNQFCLLYENINF